MASGSGRAARPRRRCWGRCCVMLVCVCVCAVGVSLEGSTSEVASLALDGVLEKVTEVWYKHIIPYHKHSCLDVAVFEVVKKLVRDARLVLAGTFRVVISFSRAAAL